MPNALVWRVLFLKITRSCSKFLEPAAMEYERVRGVIQSFMLSDFWLSNILAPSVCDPDQVLVGGRHDYVVWKLCGTFVTDTTTASTTGLLDLSFQVKFSALEAMQTKNNYE